MISGIYYAPNSGKYIRDVPNSDSGIMDILSQTQVMISGIYALNLGSDTRDNVLNSGSDIRDNVLNSGRDIRYI